jgi:pimeloyl-ACP methyl ester carboxylesterase
MPTLNDNGETLHYVQTGGGSATLVLIHGAGGEHGTWTRQLEGLADAARVVALDLPGHGGSSGDGCRSIRDYAMVVQRFLVALGRGPVVLGGHSMGGAITPTVSRTSPAARPP